MPAPVIEMAPVRPSSLPPARPSAAPGWRVPAAIVLLVVLVCLAVFLIVVGDLRTDADRQAAAQMQVQSAGRIAP